MSVGLSERVSWQARTRTTIFPFLVFLVAFFAIIALFIWAFLELEEGRFAERGPACAASLERLMAADTMVALEREKYLLDAMGCRVWRQVQNAGAQVR
ncbi:hypothetical protein [Paracraurococcus ruber]|nr:hypothetical protein [Paracraurococcus ruber]TDG28546.1 hypothetical protein E2C05_20440 [Paracraurococcus ruber]